jgi:hypothetical protein
MIKKALLLMLFIMCISIGSYALAADCGCGGIVDADELEDCDIALAMGNQKCDDDLLDCTINAKWYDGYGDCIDICPCGDINYIAECNACLADCHDAYPNEDYLMQCYLLGFNPNLCKSIEQLIYDNCLAMACM